MSNGAACGNFGMHSQTQLKRSEKSLNISFQLLSYHPDTSRKLTFEEYKKTACKPWHLDMHEDQLYMMNVEMLHLNRPPVEILFIVVDNNGRDLRRLCNMSNL